MFTIRDKKLTVFTVFFLIVLSIWWASIFIRGLKEGIENDLFTVIYPLVSIWGGIAGLLISRKWGGWKSILGKAFGAFSLGLLGQAFGQICYSYYIYVLKIEVPYPSVGDFGYFATGIFYAIGSIQLMKATGVKFSIGSYSGRALAIIIPLLWALGSYYFFLKGYMFDWSNPLVIVLDLVSPIIDGIYLSLAILTFLLSRKFLGGLMRLPILLLLLSVIAEAVSDFTFLYQESREIWYVGGVNDYMYLVTYVLMTFTLLQLGRSFKKITEGKI